MVALETSVASVAVNSTSMFVATNDGRLNLYNGDALHRASGAPIEASFSLDLRASGAPTCLFATRKGGNRLFVGTKEGDVLRCEAAKGDMQV